MPQRINANKPHLWKADVAASVDQFNQWFLRFAPEAFKTTRATATARVEAALIATNDLRTLTPDMLKAHPECLPTLRMSTAPPLAVDRLIGLSGVGKNLVGCMEKGILPKKMNPAAIHIYSAALCHIIARLLDTDIFPWLEIGHEPTENERSRAATIVADRMCSAFANDMVRTVWKRHQFAVLTGFLESLGYRECRHPADQPITTTPPGMYQFNVTVPLVMGKYDRISFDVLIQPRQRRFGVRPILLDVRSAATFAYGGTRRDAGVMKLLDLRMNYGESFRYVLMLGGMFETGYLGTQAAEGLDWVWQHRVQDLGRLINHATALVHSNGRNRKDEPWRGCK